MPLYLGNRLVAGQPLPVDKEPKEGSNNLVTSGGVFKALTGGGVSISALTGTNLLVNYDFLNPINQRGLTQYNAPGYTIDRWFVNGGEVIVGENGLEYVVADLGHAYQQYVDDYRSLRGENLTASFFLGEGAAKVFFAFGEGARVESEVGGPGVVTVTTTVPENAEYVLVGLEPAVIGERVQMMAAKLEQGDTQSLGKYDEEEMTWELKSLAPNKEIELIKCITSTADPADEYANKVLYHSGNCGALSAVLEEGE